MKYFLDINDQHNFKVLVCQDLKELGVKAPKPKKNKWKEDPPVSVTVFGTALNQAQCSSLEGYGSVPRFLVNAFRILEKYIDSEGIFRRTGSVARIKELKQNFERGDEVPDAQVNDVASLVKQFFRELPDPLLTARLFDTFMKCHQVEQERDKVTAILLTCHLLPDHHLSTLRYTMLFLRRLADQSEQNKMDVANLAVCLAQNLLHPNSQSKANQAETKLVGAQTDIIQYLITNADCIGMVSDDLYHRLTLMETCFVPSEDELEKSEANITENRASGKKKKKRSGSFQGFVSNLSNSFSKLRRDSSKAHNQSTVSDKSSMSILSVAHLGDKSTAGDVEGNYEYDFTGEGATPKVIRKRKANEEAVPFSASKRMAILQNMPQKSTLGGNTPFKTPAHMRTRDGVSDAGVLFPSTPRMKMESALFSPSSATKVKRSSSGKSRCFTPKTPKSNVRRKMKGLFRRLSGGKDPQADSPGTSVMNASDIGARLSGQDYESIAGKRPDGGRRHKQRRKTPSSPARLVGNLMSNDDNLEDDDEDDPQMALDSSMSSLVSGTSSNPSIASLVRLHGKPDGVRSPATSSEISEIGDDGQIPSTSSQAATGLNRSGLKRGKPNTMRSGLPSPAKRRSIDNTLTRDQYEDDDEEDNEREVRNFGVLTTVDTSPIQSDAAALSHRNLIADEEEPELEMIKPLQKAHSEGDITDVKSDFSGGEDDTALGMTRQSSTTSIMSVTESDHDRAFINESMLNDLEEPEPKQENEDSDGFKMPIGIPRSTSLQSRNPSTSVNSSTSDTSDASICTVIYKGPTGSTIVDRNLTGQSKSDSQLGNAKSMESIDSGIGCDDGRLSKSMSLQSMGSSETNQSEEDLSSSFNSQSATRGRARLQLSSETQNILSRAGASTGDEQDGESVKEIRERHESPLRFSQSQMRRQRGVSPIRIPTIFAKADQEQCQKYREMGRAAMRHSPRMPSLPIGTDLVNAVSVQNARSRLANEDNVSETPSSSAGHTPKRLGPKSTLSVKDAENTDQDIAPSTPKIKPVLMKTDVTKRVLAVVPPNPSEQTPARKHARSPIKPVKRLKGSPKSPNPRRNSKSPHKVLNKSAEQRLSPLPKHMDTDEWDV